MNDRQDSELPGVHLSPNIQSDPDLYEIENEAVDPEWLIEAAMENVAAWDGRTVLDLGAGTGFHLARWAERAAEVFAVEPHGASRLRAMARVVGLGLENVSVIRGSAEQIPLPDHSVDVAHARFAYFFPPNCEAGLRELERVMKPGGTAFVVDNDYRSGAFTSWLLRSPWVPDHSKDADAVESFWLGQGFSITRVESEWRFKNRLDLESVIRLEFPPDVADDILRSLEGASFDCHYNLYYRTYPATHSALDDALP